MRVPALTAGAPGGPRPAAVRCYVYARAPAPSGGGRPGPWLAGMLPGGAAVLPHAPVSRGDDPAAAAALVARLTGRTPRLLAPPVPPLPGAGSAWWIRAPRGGPYASEHEYVMTLPGTPPPGLEWRDPRDPPAADPRPAPALALALALGAVLDALIAGRHTAGVLRAMTLGHSRRDVGPPRPLPRW
ncbi:hypothetical protein ABZY31_22415 [Streptomyces sp. NPDC006529]|uniref:hypothetical protein n=1 Tax=Streptomyces sp. NPDC006529 TaxID=3157177 RepID=UPI0033B10501